MLNCIIEALALAGTLLPLVVVLPLMAALAIGRGWWPAYWR